MKAFDTDVPMKLVFRASHYSYSVQVQSITRNAANTFVPIRVMNPLFVMSSPTSYVRKKERFSTPAS